MEKKNFSLCLEKALSWVTLRRSYRGSYCWLSCCTLTSNRKGPRIKDDGLCLEGSLQQMPSITSLHRCSPSPSAVPAATGMLHVSRRSCLAGVLRGKEGQGLWLKECSRSQMVCASISASTPGSPLGFKRVIWTKQTTALGAQHGAPEARGDLSSWRARWG